MKKKKLVTIGLVQTACGSDSGENFRRTADLIVSAASRGARIICTEELFTSAYFCQTQDTASFRLAAAVDGKNRQVKELSGLAKKLKAVIIANFFEKRTDGIFHNTSVVLDADGRLLGKYRKMHIPDDPHFHEKFYFTPGDLGYRTFATKYGRVGVLICWDQWYPEAARLTAMQGAQILFYPTAIGWLPSEKKEFGPRQYGAWETIQRAHAVANGCYVASVNRVGYEKSPDGDEGIEFWGSSFVAGPYGEIIGKASASKEEVLVAPVDLDEIHETRAIWPFFRDRRIDSYGDITRRFSDE